MAKRGTLYRCHLCSFLFGDEGTQTEGINAFWTQNLEPIGDRDLLSGTVVELYARIDGPGLSLSPDSLVRLDILEEDILVDDKVDSLVGMGANPPDEGFNMLQRETEYVTLGDNECIGDFVNYLRRNRAPEYRDRIFLIEEFGDPPVFHVIAFYEVQRREETLGDSEFYFILNIDNKFEDQAKELLNVKAEKLPDPPAGAVFEDQVFQPEVDLVVMRDAFDQVFSEFQSEEDALREGWAPPEPSTPPRSPESAEVRRRLVVSQPAPPPLQNSEVTASEPWPWKHPQGGVENDQVFPGPSPFDNNVIAIFRPWDDFRVTSNRYAVSFDFNRAIRWGQLLFGARAFVIVEGPIAGSVPPRYFTLRTNRLFALGAAQIEEVAGSQTLVGVDVRYWQIEQRDSAHNMYVVRVIGTSDNAVVVPNFPTPRTETFAQLAEAASPEDLKDSSKAELAARGAFNWHWLENLIPHDLAERQVFATIRDEIQQNRSGSAADLLIDLNFNAFALVSPEERGKFLSILLNNLTVARRTIGSNIGERTETAILEIVRSVKSPDELKTIIGQLQGLKEIKMIVNRMDSKLWSMLIYIGERLGINKTFTIDFDFLLDLFQSPLGSNPALLGTGFHVNLRADGSIDLDLLGIDQLQTIANTFLNFGKSFLEGIATLILHPDKVLKGLFALVKAIVMMGLASQGVPFAMEWVQKEVIPLLMRAANSLFNAWKGAQILAEAIGGDDGKKFLLDIVMRVKWAIIWEVASLFVGVGEIVGATKAVASAVSKVARGVEEAAGVLRLSRSVMGGERALGKLDDFARLAENTGGIQNATRLLGHLPPENVRLLERKLADLDPKKFKSFEELSQHLGAEGKRFVNQIGDQLRSLNALDTKLPGRLTTDGADAFATLTRLTGTDDAKLAQVISSISTDETKLLFDTAAMIPPSATSAGAALSFDTVRAIAGRPASFNALRREGYQVFSGILEKSGGDLRLAEKNFEALRVLRNQTTPADHAVLLDKLMAGERTAIADLQNARHTLDVMKGRCVL